MFVIVVLFWVEFFWFLVGCLLCRCLSILDCCHFDINALAYESIFFLIVFFCLSVCSKCFWYPQKTNWFHPLRGCRRLQAGDSLQVESQSRSGIPGTGLEI